MIAISEAIESLEVAIHRSDNNKTHHNPAQKSEVFLTEYFEEEDKEKLSATPVPSNAVRDGDRQEEYFEDDEINEAKEQKMSAEPFRRKDTLTPLQFRSQGLDKSHYSKDNNNIAVKPPLPDEILHGPQVADGQTVKSSRTCKLYNTPQLLQSSQATSLDMKQHINSQVGPSTFINSNDTKSKLSNGGFSNGQGMPHHRNARFASKFSELRVQHRQEKLPEEVQMDKPGHSASLTKEGIQQMESARRKRSSKAYVWKPKDKINVAQFPWKSTADTDHNDDGKFYTTLYIHVQKFIF